MEKERDTVERRRGIQSGEGQDPVGRKRGIP